LSVRQIEQRSETLDFDPASLTALLVTHEHDDHISGVAALARRFRIPVHLSAGTRRAACARLAMLPCVHEFCPGVPFDVGPFTVLPVIVPHDASEPCQFIIATGDSRLGVLTDLGQLTPHLERHFIRLDALHLEFNHDPTMLERSAYPPGLRARIAGSYGHLSNTQAEELLRRIDKHRLRWVTAAHLSEKTNTPAHVQACLERVLPAHVEHHITTQSLASPWFDLGAARAGAAAISS
jgi:phosphoribosyl 1,2-cyclic phosphodiesterase